MPGGTTPEWDERVAGDAYLLTWDTACRTAPVLATEVAVAPADWQRLMAAVHALGGAAGNVVDVVDAMRAVCRAAASPYTCWRPAQSTSIACANVRSEASKAAKAGHAHNPTRMMMRSHVDAVLADGAGHPIAQDRVDAHTEPTNTRVRVTELPIRY